MTHEAHQCWDTPQEFSRVSAYELVHTPGFPAFRSGRLIKISKKAFFDWMEKGTETLPKSSR